VVAQMGLTVVRDGKLAFAAWPEARLFLAQVDILKTDAVKAERQWAKRRSVRLHGCWPRRWGIAAAKM